MLVSTVAITAIVAVGVLGWRAASGGGRSSGGAGGEWDEIALVNRSSGAVTTVDADGATVDTTVGLGRVTAVHQHGDHLALVGADQIALVAPDSDPVTIPIERGSTVTPVRTTDALHLVVGRATGGNVLVIDATTGEVLDIGALAEQGNPLLFAETLRWSADGSAFAVADAANFQTIVVQPGVPGATFLPDQPVAVGDNLVATSQTVGRQADIALLDLDRRSQANVPTEIPAGGLMIDDALVMVATDGGVYRIERGSEEASRVGVVAVPAGANVRSVYPTADGGRLLVAGSVFAAVVDLDGRTVFTTTFTTPVELDAPHPDWVCLAVGGGDTYHSLVSLESGEQLADLTGLTVTGTSADGCVVIGERGGLTEVVSADGIVGLGQVRDATIGPDGRSVVRTTTTGTTQLLRIDDDLQLGDPIELTDAPSSLAVTFLTS